MSLLESEEDKYLLLNEEQIRELPLKDQISAFQVKVNDYNSHVNKSRDIITDLENEEENLRRQGAEADEQLRRFEETASKDDLRRLKQLEAEEQYEGHPGIKEKIKNALNYNERYLNQLQRYKDLLELAKLELKMEKREEEEKRRILLANPWIELPTPPKTNVNKKRKGGKKRKTHKKSQKYKKRKTYKNKKIKKKKTYKKN